MSREKKKHDGREHIQEQKNFHSERLTILPSTLIYVQDDVIRIDALAQRQIFAFLNEKTAER